MSALTKKPTFNKGEKLEKAKNEFPELQTSILFQYLQILFQLQDTCIQKLQ